MGGGGTQESNNSETLWLAACTKGNLDIVKHFVENGQDIEATDGDGVTGLKAASFCGKANVVRFLLSKGARTDRTSENGNSPLSFAAHEGHLEVCKELVAKGAAVNQETDDGLLPTGMYLEVELFVEKGQQDIEATDSDGFNGLIFASFNGRANVVRFLLLKGAHVDQTDPNGFTALDLAVRQGHGEIVEILTRHASASAN